MSKNILPEHVIYLRDKMNLTYSQIGKMHGAHPDKIRSIYRRATGTHTPEQKLVKMREQQEQFEPLYIELEKNSITKIAFPTDEHYPWQDDGARSVALKIVADFNPDIRIAGSDGMDFYAISKYNKNPSRIKEGGIATELKQWQAGQREWLDASPNADVIFIPGNHEDRWTTWLWKHPEIYGLEALKLSNILELKGIGIRHTAQEIIFGNVLVIKHGAIIRKFAGSSAKAELENERYAISTMTGHSHRSGSIFMRTRRGMIQGHECFCLCNLEPEYVAHPDWQQGIALAIISNNVLTVELIPFIEKYGRKYAIWRDKEYTEF